MNVLVVEFDEEYAAAVEWGYRAKGHDVEVAPDIQKAREILELGGIDQVVINYYMGFRKRAEELLNGEGGVIRYRVDESKIIKNGYSEPSDIASKCIKKVR